MSEESAATAEPLQELISSLEASSIDKKSNGNEQNTSLPTPLQLYQMGLVMHDLNETSTLAQKYKEWLAQVPITYLKEVAFHDLNAAFISVTKRKNDEQSFAAINSLCTLYANSPVACQAGFTIELCASMANLYDSCQVVNKSRQQEECSDSLLRGLSALLLDGWLVSNDNDQESHLERVMEVVRTLTTNDRSTCLGDLQEWQQHQIGSKTLQKSIRSQFDASPQRDYLLKMLESCPTASSAKPNAPSKQTVPPTGKLNTQKSAVSELQRRILQVREVLPELGEGYVETALSCYQGDVSRTVAALLEGQANPTSLHPTLQVMDTKLPARRQEAPKSTKYQLDDEEAKRITKSRLAEMEQKEEAAAYALTVMNSEYNDDYDDQYDGEVGGAGGADVGMYDVDLDTIKTYNRVAREAEQEDSFWEENKNRNRQGASKKGNNGGGEKQYRGPNKGKGGRVIGPDGKYVPFQKGGKKGRQQKENAKKAADASENGGDKKMTKIQQRRKNDNKAKVANHHRKERAQKKAAGGM